MSGIGPKSFTKCFSSAAPVGVQSSPRTSPPYTGTPSRMRAVRWRGDRQHAVGAAHRAAAYEYRRGGHARGRELVHEQRDGRDVGDGVHRADFVEVYLSHGHAVDGAFGFRDYFVDGERAGFRRFGHIEAREYRFDLRHARVMVMAATSVFVLMFMLMAVLASFVVDMFFMAMFVPALAHFFVKIRAAVFVYVRLVVSMFMAMPVFLCALFFAVYQDLHARAFYAAI